MSEISVRHYNESDLAAVGEISADTAFFGDQVETFLDDRRLYFDAFARYYLENEAPYAWVGEESGEVIGFLFGCVDTSAQLESWRSYVLHNVLKNAIRLKYKLGRRTASFAFGMLKSALRQEKYGVDLEQFPAHLQIDVKPDHRGKGVGKKLIAAYLGQLRQLLIPGVHLETTSHNIVACYVYEKIGFRLLGSRINRYWSRWFGYQIDDRIYGLLLK